MTEQDEGSGANITDNLGTQAQDAAGTQQSAITSPDVPRGTQEGAASPTEPTPEKFQGQDRDQVLKSYINLEREHSELSEKSKQLENWCNRVGVFFTMDADDRVTLNEEMVKAYAENKGWPDKWNGNPNQANSQTTNPTEPTKEQIMENLENDPKSTIRDLVGEALKDALKPMQEQILSTNQNFMNSQHQSWINEVRNENPKEFDDLRMEMGKLIKEHDLEGKIRGPNDIRKILRWTKTELGRMVDKNVHESQIGELNKTLSILDPSFGSPSRSADPEASIDDLLGGGVSPTGSENEKVSQALLGKRSLRP